MFSELAANHPTFTLKIQQRHNE